MNGRSLEERNCTIKSIVKLLEGKFTIQEAEDILDDVRLAIFNYSTVQSKRKEEHERDNKN